ncbi:MAG: helix-turn-helix transcriptional regulator [Clostridiales bacterium]|nr:helix-turn-helix transcriptional regulator [Clostridiales bacterium]
MDNFNEINNRIAQNLVCYRKMAGFTQAELAEKINYSDKSVSKWEQGNGVPDVYVLIQLAQIYNVTLDELIGEDATKKVQEQKKRRLASRILVTLLSSGIVWLVATCLFVTTKMALPTLDWWLAFIYAISANAIVIIVYAGVWRYRFLSFVSVSALIWSLLLSVYLTLRLAGVESGSLWLIFLLGIPLEVLEILWVFFRFLFGRKDKKTKKNETA